MKTFLLTIFVCFFSATQCYSQTITLSLKNVSLEKAFKEIRKQTGYTFVYTREQIKNSLPVTCNVVKSELKEVLSICSRNQPFSFVIEENYIVVQTKNATLQPIPQSDSLIEIKGHVMNENGEPLSGATIIVKHSNKGVSTDNKGDFILQGINDEDVLIISNVGFYREEVPINKQRFFL